MFVIEFFKMKQILALYILFLASTLSHSQTLPEDYLKIILNPTLKKGTKPQEVIIPIINLDSKENNIDIKSEFWDTVNFNPYRNEIAKFPIEIKFEDTTFASPIKKEKVITSRYGWRN